jgi:hypothetical protein
MMDERQIRDEGFVRVDEEGTPVVEHRPLDMKDLAGPLDVVHLPQVLNDEFGLSLSEARRILTYGVEIDSQPWTGGLDVPLEEIDGKLVRVKDQTKSLMFTYRPARDRYFG